MTNIIGNWLRRTGGIIKPTTNATDTLKIVDTSDNPVITADTTNRRVGIGTDNPVATAHILAQAGNIDSAYIANANQGGANLRVANRNVQTTGATPATLHTFNLEADSAYHMTAFVTAKQTGGAAGTVGHIATYLIRGSFRRIGTADAVQVGALNVAFTAEDDVTWDATFDATGTTARIRVTGALNKTIQWHSSVIYFTL